MSDADTAYEIAEQRIERARAEGLNILSFDPGGLDEGARAKFGGNAVWEADEALAALERIPPQISNLDRLEILDLCRTSVAELSALTNLTTLRVLDCAQTPVANLTSLKKLVAMQELRLNNTQVTDLSPLARMGAMQTLYLSSTQVTDLSPLAGMGAMQTLWLDSTQVTDLSPLAGMVAMQGLDLSGTQVTDLSPLAGMVAMQTLYLDSTQVTDLSPLAGMVAMQTLTLNNTQVTDLSPLARMGAMQTLYLSSTQVTDLSPLAGMGAMQTLWLDSTQADLSGLVAPGAAWEREDHKLEDIEFKSVPVEDEVLATLGEKSTSERLGLETLARLRELRDMVPPPAAARDPAPTGPFVFLSYAHTDRPAAFRLKSALEKEGIPLWWDQMIDPGADWDAELRRRVTSAHSVLVLWSEASAASEHVRDEAQRARRANTIAPVMIEPLSEDQLPQPFGGRHTLDLSHWDGARDDEVFQRLVSFLKLRQIGAQSPVTTRFNDEGLLELAERPVGAAPLREDEVRRSRLLRSQADLSRDMAGVIEEELGENLSNQDKRLILRTASYERALRTNEDLIWETLDASFQRANGLIRWDELDEGMKPTVQTWRDQHGALKEYIQPAQPPEDQAPDDQVAPDDVAEVMDELAEVAADLEAAASAETDPAPVTAPIPRLLQSHVERMARERDDPDGPSKASEQAGRSRTGKAVRAALGVLSGVAAGVTVHAWAVTGPGAPLLNKMVALAEKLFALL